MLGQRQHRMWAAAVSERAKVIKNETVRSKTVFMFAVGERKIGRQDEEKWKTRSLQRYFWFSATWNMKFLEVNYPKNILERKLYFFRRCRRQIPQNSQQRVEEIVSRVIRNETLRHVSAWVTRYRVVVWLTRLEIGKFPYEKVFSLGDRMADLCNCCIPSRRLVDKTRQSSLRISLFWMFPLGIASRVSTESAENNLPAVLTNALNSPTLRSL